MEYPKHVGIWKSNYRDLEISCQDTGSANLPTGGTIGGWMAWSPFTEYTRCGDTKDAAVSQVKDDIDRRLASFTPKGGGGTRRYIRENGAGRWSVTVTGPHYKKSCMGLLSREAAERLAEKYEADITEAPNA